MSDLQANRDTATIAITVMMAAISASWIMRVLRCCGLSGMSTFGVLLLGKADPGFSHFK
jgi:hypothetical protein